MSDEKAEWTSVHSKRGRDGMIHLKLAEDGVTRTACGRRAGSVCLAMGGGQWCQPCDDNADRFYALHVARKARAAGGVMGNRPCLCGCGYPTAQANGYVRGHTPKRGA